jgi:tetratricopeptide (TPR) repeat protein
VASLHGDSSYSKALRSLILALADKKDEASRILNELKRQPKLDPVTLIALADTYSVLGDKDEAFEFLEAAFQERAGLLILLGIRPTLDNIRSDPRYADLLRRMGLSQGPLPKPS